MELGNFPYAIFNFTQRSDILVSGYQLNERDTAVNEYPET